MRKRYLAVTQLELNLRFNENGGPTRHHLQALLLDPSEGWRAQPLDLRYPGSDVAADSGDFITSAVGDLHGSGSSELVYAVTLDSANCYLLSYRYDGATWRARPIVNGLPAVNYLRSISLGDLDQDGADEIVIGSRPNGAVLVLDGGPTGYAATLIDRDQYGKGTTNTREVLVADVDCDGANEIVVATAQAGAGKWHATPGAIFVYRRSREGWDRILVEDHDNLTHTRMLAVANVKSDGVKRIVSSAVGVVRPETGRIDPQPELRLHTLVGTRAECEPIGVLENMVKSRSFAFGDIDGYGGGALVVGTRALGTSESETTCLFVYRLGRDGRSWDRETLDTSGHLGFHSVMIGDVDGDGRSEIVASDDGRGTINLYKKQKGRWQREEIYAVDGILFCTGLHLIDVSPVGP